MKILNKTLVITAVFIVGIFFFGKESLAACSTGSNSYYTGGDVVMNAPCAFSGSVNGVDNGHLTIDSGSTLTILNEQTIVWNPGFEVRLVSGNIVTNDTGELRKNYIFMRDADGDGWPASFEQSKGVDSTSTDLALKRRYLMRSLLEIDCDDNAYSTSNDCSSSCVASCGSWGPCSASCGGGTQTRTCTNTDCSTYTQSQSCNTQACEPSATCNQGTWQNVGCGLWGCTNQMAQGNSWQWSDGSGECNYTARCVSDPSCSVTCNQGTWQNIGCGLWGCASNQMTQGNSWQWSDGSGECNYTARCVASSSCAPSCTPGTFCGTSGHFHYVYGDPGCAAQGYGALVTQSTHYYNWSSSCTCNVYSYETYGATYCAN